MNTNDFRSVGLLISDEFFLDWPQSNERIRGRDNLATMNEQYPAYVRRPHFLRVETLSY